MRAKWCVFCNCLAFVFLLIPFASQAQAVHAWEGSIVIPTYKLGPADPNPPFPLISRFPVYPYTMLDDLGDAREPVEYRAIYLENQYLKIIILPDLGGHVYSIYDKIDHREVLYRNHVIKYGLVGPRGAWISGGMEFSFPFAHTTVTVSPVESVLRHNADGSATAVVGALDWVSNMHWEVALTLCPNAAYLKEDVTLFNATPLNHLYLFWTNTAVKASDDLQYVYPMRETISDDPYAIVRTWPVWNGVDESWYKNNPSAMAIFARDVHRNFFGVYYHQANYGVVHVADFREDPGKKLWTWGTSGQGKSWDHILSDADGSYNEIQSGRFYTQGYREFMNPRRVEKWTEYWYPVRGLDGGFAEATSQMTVNVTYRQAGQGRPEVRLAISPVANVTDATVVLKQGSNILREFHGAHLAPLQPVDYVVPVQSIENAKKNLNILIQSPEGKVLLQWSAAAPIDGNSNFVPLAGKALEKEISVTPRTSVEEMYLHGVFLEKSRKLHDALQTYDQVLERDPGYVPALMKEAVHCYEAADFQQAESLIARAMERGKEDPSVAYLSGINYRAEGRMSLAKDAFWRAIHYGAPVSPGPTLAASFVELGEIAIHQGSYMQAAGLLERAVKYNPNDAFALADLATAERLGGNRQDAIRNSTEAVQKMPLLPYALAEQWQDRAAFGSKAGRSPQADTSWTKVIRSDSQNYIAIASWYHGLGAWQSSDRVLHFAKANLPAQSLSPMIDYYLASNARHEGQTQQADKYAQEAAASNLGTSVFPNRLMDVAILTEAVRHNPADAHAQYALGNFFFAHGRYRDAAGLWQKALSEGFDNSVLLCNLGVYEWHVEKNPVSAAKYYSMAIRLSPEDYRLYSDLDQIYEQEGDTAARTGLFQSAPSGVLDRDAVRARHALLLIEQSQYDQALAILMNHRFKPREGGVVIHNMFVTANMEKGKKALADHQPAEAAEAFRQAMLYPENVGTGEPSQPETAEQLYWLGNALEAQNKNAEARAAWTNAAAQKKSKTAAGTVFSALAYRKLGQNEIARQILQRCIHSATQPDAEAADYFAAGMAEQYSNHPELAQKNFHQALQLDPLFWQARIASKSHWTE